MTLKLIKIRAGEEATSRPVSPEESRHMLSVRKRLEQVEETLLLKNRPEGSIADVHHLVYLANRESFGNGHHEDASHNTPLLIIDGDAHHEIAFRTFGYDAQSVKAEEVPIEPKPNHIVITEDRLTAENAHELIPKLARISNLQIHRIAGEIDIKNLQLKGWETHIEMYRIDDRARNRLIPVRRGGVRGKIDAWVILKKIKGKN